MSSESFPTSSTRTRLIGARTSRWWCSSSNASVSGSTFSLLVRISRFSETKNRMHEKYSTSLFEAVRSFNSSEIGSEPSEEQIWSICRPSSVRSLNLVAGALSSINLFKVAEVCA
ncbi:hypothetical protein OGAPHI_005869 [Ogataea philodendri]|uniref:Uncharacterized protein n=1 Tax=Ogataea philodendri TaxID=1378263 RepID=A0A9P8NZY5_9ASCO|nr:uncharacterized protein OGAPHI_005869 [Ogataea philodendri]KAH3662617.1 hypothetical protein OGAPHI_005869 [Ogataea philodendri]